MKETKKNTIYQTPKVTVVNFTVEGGFGASNLKAEPQSTSSTLGIEEVTDGGSLGNYFPRSN